MKCTNMACLLFALLLQGCASNVTHPLSLVAPATSGAAIERPANVHSRFTELSQHINDSFTDVESVIVMRRGSTIFEHYKSGADADTLRETQSVTKGVLSLLVGIALDNGSIATLDEPITGVSAHQAQPIVLRHLLTMTSGFDTTVSASWADTDRPQYLLLRPTVSPPSTVFRYDNLGANLLSIVLENAVNETAENFAKTKFFAPLGIDIFKWQKGANGHNYGSSGLRLRTRDMAKVGQLMLQEGVWNGRQLISKAYVRAATRRQTAQGMPPYGYLWWLAEDGKNADADATSVRQPFYASGFGGQIIWVQPALDLVVVTTAAVNGVSQSRGQAMRLIRNEIIPLIAKPALRQ